MTRSPNSSSRPRSSRGPNLAAILITAGVITYVYLNSDPVISGTEPDAHSTVLTPPPRFALPPAPPQAVRASDQSEVATAESTAVEEEQIASQANVDPDVLTGRWAMLFSVMLLEKGCEQFADVNDYTRPGELRVPSSRPGSSCCRRLRSVSGPITSPRPNC